MTSRSENEAGQPSPVDLQINKRIRELCARQGSNPTELGRRLMIPYSSWARKVSDRPSYHQRYSADEVVRIAAALHVTPNDLLLAGPVVSSEG